jgi:hypothetical protein
MLSPGGNEMADDSPIAVLPRSAPGTVAFVTIFLILAGTAGAQSDDFDDGVTGPQWSLVIDQPGTLDLAETAGSLSILGQTAGAASNDALYLSDGPAGFRLSTTANFAVQVDYDFAAVQASAGAGAQLALVFGVGRDVAGTDSAAVAYAVADTGTGLVGALGFAWRTDNIQTNGVPDLTRPATGTLFITWSTADDLLSLGDGTRTYSLENTVLGAWNADALFVSFGGRGAGLQTLEGDATLDNFLITAGSVVAVPEPSALLLLPWVVLLSHRRRRISPPCAVEAGGPVRAAPWSS